jgi:hypothetical protein
LFAPPVPVSGEEGTGTPAGNTTRILIKSRQEIEDELENLSREYADKKFGA